MEASAIGANARNVSMSMPSSSRKEWRAVTEHHSVRNSVDEEVERSKLGQSDERTIYEHGSKTLDAFCSITVDGNLDDDILQQRVQSIARQRVELEQMETELRAQLIARAGIMEIQHSFDVQMKEHASAAIKLQDQLHERDQTIHELERKIEGKDQELHAIKIEHEAAWAKEDLLREQNKELATFRRERDHSETERAQHLQQLHDIQQHFQEKERQLMDLQEQHRVAQETIIFKDEQLREAQAWIARVQEMDVLQSTSLQAELRDRTEQLNQLWHGCQRQFSEMERLHMHRVQQLQHELADARERSGSYNETNLKDAPQFVQNNGNQLDLNGGSGTSSGSMTVLPNGNSDSAPYFASTGNVSTQIDLVPGLPLAPSSLLGMPTFFPPGQVTPMHPFVMHQQGVSQSVPSHLPQSQVGHFQSTQANSSLQQWQNQQAVPEGSQISTHNPPQTDQSSLSSGTNYDYGISVNGQTLHSEFLDVHGSQGIKLDSVNLPSPGETQVFKSIDRSHLVAPLSEQSLQHISSQFHDALRLDPLEQNREPKEQKILTLINQGLEGHGLPIEQASSAANTLPPDTSVHTINLGETTIENGTGASLPESYVLTGQKSALTAGRTLETNFLDERSLLACIARTIPAGGRIRISSTLPNRLGKMLAPLHWHDYKKLYGKLDDFVTSHPELFVTEDDYIQLREGAQEMIAATAAVAKVAAAAAASSPLSSFLPSVAVTPMAQAHRLKKVPSMDSKHVKSENTASNTFVTTNATDNPLPISLKLNQHSNGVSFTGGYSNIKILSKSKDLSVLNGAEAKNGQNSVFTVGNGASPDRLSGSSTRYKTSTNGRPGSNLVGKQPGRTGAAATSRR